MNISEPERDISQESVTDSNNGLNIIMEDGAVFDGTPFIIDNETVQEKSWSDANDPNDTPEMSSEEVIENTYKALFLTAVKHTMTLKTYTTAELNAFAGASTKPPTGFILRCADGAYGNVCTACFDGTYWLRTDNNLPIRTTPYSKLQVIPVFIEDMPDASTHLGNMIYVINGAAGSPIMAFSNGSDWCRCDNRAVVSGA